MGSYSFLMGSLHFFIRQFFFKFWVFNFFVSFFVGFYDELIMFDFVQLIFLFNFFIVDCYMVVLFFFSFCFLGCIVVFDELQTSTTR